MRDDIVEGLKRGIVQALARRGAQGTYLAVVHENEHRPYKRRTVQVRLTDEQRRALQPQHTGIITGTPTHEEFLTAWLEPATTPLPAETSQ